MIYKKFISLISEKIKQKGYTLKKVASFANVDVSYLSRILSGQRNPPHEEETIKKIAKILEIDEDELIFAAGKIPKKYQNFFCSRENLENVLKLIQQNKKQTKQFKTMEEKNKIEILEKNSTPEELL